MASDRKIAANRRNARKSTGPRSRAGKKQSRANSYRHGLAARTNLSAERNRTIEEFARALAGDTSDTAILAYARDAAQAEFDLAQIRRVKVALIGRMATFGQFEATQALDTMPGTETECMAEAVRRVLPELLKLDRYERRAARRRTRSLRALLVRTEQIRRLTVRLNVTQR